MTIGIISNDVATTPFAGAMLAGAQEVAWRNGWLLLLVNSNGDPEMEKSAVRSLIQRNVDGFIYAAWFHQEIQTPAYLNGKKIILLDCIDTSNKYESVVPNEYQGATDAVQYLVDQGHTRIAHISTTENTIASRERLKAFKDVMKSNGLDYNSEFIVKVKSPNASDGYIGAKKLLELVERPTAIFCYTDRLAMGAYEAIAETGLSIPKDISVVGFDNQVNVADALRPTLTTVQLPHFEMGAWAATRLLEAIDPENSEPLTQHGQVITCPLVIRDSVAPPKK
jgi:LacI family transcriptional regulator